MTLKDHLRSLGDKEFLEDLANSEPREKKEDSEKEGEESLEKAEQAVKRPDRPAVPAAAPVSSTLRKTSLTTRASGKASEVIVSLTADGRTAKGFVVDSNGTILTNLHLVGSAEKIRVEFPSGDVFLARLSREDARRDLALLKIPGQTPKFASFGSVAGLDVGDSVLVMAKAASPTGQLVEATVCALRTIDGTSYVQVDQTLAPQDSGSPFLDRDGRILGISNVRSGDSTPDVAFAVSVNEVKNFISGQ